jgi:alpha/beta hydrolase fold
VIPDAPAPVAASPDESIRFDLAQCRPSPDRRCYVCRTGYPTRALAALTDRDAALRTKRHMIRRIAIFLSIFAVLAGGYFAVCKWGIHHQTLTFYDPARNFRPVMVDVAARRDKEIEADLGLTELPVAILNHGNTIGFTEYSYLTNMLAARGYLAISIQHDLDTDAPLMTLIGEPYVGRVPVYERGIADILFAIAKLRSVAAPADYDHLTMIGHSNGGDIAMYFAKLFPDRVKRVVTLDNLRVPFVTNGNFPILSFRSMDPAFQTDPGVVPDDDVCEKAGITVVRTDYQHTDMSDRGPEDVKVAIQQVLDQFLEEDAPVPVVTSISQSTQPGRPLADASDRAGLAFDVMHFMRWF